MPDFTDEATELEELQRDIALRKARSHKPLPNKGSCYNCDDTIRNGLFCSPECREDYEIREKRMR
jgi:hypothetical protein